MMHNIKNIEVKSEASNTSDEFDDVTQETGQENSTVALASQKDARLIESSENKVNFNETRQQKMDPLDFAQQKIDSTISNQIQLKSTKSLHQDIGSIKPSEVKTDFIQSSEEQAVIVVKYEEGEGQENQLRLTQAGQESEPSSKLSRYFHLNPSYLVQVRGIANIVHIILSLTTVILMGLICQLRPYSHSRSEGFYCKPPKMFLFIVSCTSLFTAVLYFFCCVLSKTNDFLLFESSFEVAYFIMYFILFLTAGLILLVSEVSGESSTILINDIIKMQKYDKKLAETAVVIGLINSIVYGFSAIWFLSSHCECEQGVHMNQNQNIPHVRSEVRHSI